MRLLFILIMLCISAPTMAQENAYQNATMANLSKAYWALKKFDTSDDTAVDNYMRINECGIFRDYYFNEFEWRGIRESTRDYLKNNQKTFNKRFEFVQPLSLGAYDFERKGFKVLEDQVIDAISRFRIYANDFQKDICGKKAKVNGYPSLVAIELNRPLTLDFVPVEESIAKLVVSNKINKFKRLNIKSQNKERLYQLRDAIFVMKIKLSSLQGTDVNIMQIGTAAPILSVLEGIEVYSDRDRKELLYSVDYLRERSKSDLETKMREAYEAQKKAQEKNKSP